MGQQLHAPYVYILLILFSTEKFVISFRFTTKKYSWFENSFNLFNKRKQFHCDLIYLAQFMFKSWIAPLVLPPHNIVAICCLLSAFPNTKTNKQTHTHIHWLPVNSEQLFPFNFLGYQSKHRIVVDTNLVDIFASACKYAMKLAQKQKPKPKPNICMYICVPMQNNSLLSSVKVFVLMHAGVF